MGYLSDRDLRNDYRDAFKGKDYSNARDPRERKETISDPVANETKWQAIEDTFNHVMARFFDSGVGKDGKRHDGKPLGYGCGDKDWDSVLPDYAMGVDLMGPCRIHDNSFSTSRCSEINKFQIDARFGANVAKAAFDAHGDLRAALSMGVLAFGAVTLGGRKAYRDACIPTDP